jgi:Rhodopirellula transposase DDE domain
LIHSLVAKGARTVCAGFSSCSAIQHHKFARYLGRTSSSIRSDLDSWYTQVNVHDFIDPKLKRAVSYGVYDIANNTVSRRHQSRHRHLCRQCDPPLVSDDGKKRHPNAERLMVTADGGGSNGYRVRLWKVELQKLSDELKLPITVCHLPPDLEVEQDRASPFLVHLDQLARQARCAAIAPSSS